MGSTARISCSVYTTVLCFQVLFGQRKNSLLFYKHDLKKQSVLLQKTSLFS